MTDRELLERAAKAAGRRIHWSGNVAVLDDFQPGTDQCSAWNPLADDGDAFALEVAADIVSGPGVGNQQWASWHADGKTFFESNERPDGSADPRAARRRAIVRAAAEMAQ